MLQVWFETSQHTGRVHLHLQPDGSDPLGLSFPMDRLQQVHVPTTDTAANSDPVTQAIAEAFAFV